MNDQPRPAGRSHTNHDRETVSTATLPEGTLFVSPDDVLYQVVMAGSAGFRKAEPWPWLAHNWDGDAERPQAVALVPGSLLARNYSVVSEGTPLPAIDRPGLLGPDGQPVHFVFPTEHIAKLAAQLDETLARQTGLEARKEGRRWVLGDGRHSFRIYLYQRDTLGIDTGLADRLAEEQIKPLPCHQGPSYWRYIPGWSATPLAPIEITIPLSEPIVEAGGTEETDDAPEPVAAAPAVPRAVHGMALQPITKVASESRVDQPEAEEPQVEKPKPKRVKRAEPAAPAARKVSKTRRPSAMILSIDIGYGYTKGVGPDNLHFSFPSVVGTAEEIHFATDLIGGSEEHAVQYGDWRFFYGNQAVLQSRIQSAIFDRSRVHDDTYKMLFVATLVELAKLVPEAEHLNVITGLPVAFFGDRPNVVKSFEGVHRFTTDRTTKISVESVFVAPQPFGSLFRELLSERGKIANGDMERGRVGIIDVGTYTTDFIVSDELRYVQRASGSISIGWSKVITQLQMALGDQYTLELTPHEADRVVQDREIRIRGEPISLQSLIDPAVAEMQAAVIARARDLWGSALGLDMILVSGGGGPHLYDGIRQIYPHARLVDDAFWANVEGLYRFGQRPATFEK